MSPIDELIQSGRVQVDNAKHQIDSTQLCAWLYLDGRLCSRKAMQAQYIDVSEYVFTNQSKS